MRSDASEPAVTRVGTVQAELEVETRPGHSMQNDVFAAHSRQLKLWHCVSRSPMMILIVSELTRGTVPRLGQADGWW